MAGNWKLKSGASAYIESEYFHFLEDFAREQGYEDAFQFGMDQELQQSEEIRQQIADTNRRLIRGEITADEAKSIFDSIAPNVSAAIIVGLATRGAVLYYRNQSALGVLSTTARSQNLRANMKREGVHFDPGEEAHHIVAKKDPRAARSRELLAEAGVDLNSSANGVPLPATGRRPNPNNKAVHRGDVVHSSEYYEYVEVRLESVSPRQRPQVIRDIAGELERGEINW